MSTADCPADLDVVIAVSGVGYTFTISSRPVAVDDEVLDVIAARLRRVLDQVNGMYAPNKAERGPM